MPLCPPVVHRVLGRNDVPAMVYSKMIFIGDIHGCKEELVKLLGACHYDQERDKVICAGDLTSKGPWCAETLTYLREIGALSVRGNKDNSSIKAYDAWKRTGREPGPNFEFVKRVRDEDMTWLKTLPYTISIPWLNTIVVHAGLVPNTLLDDQDLHTITNMRDVRWDAILKRWVPVEKGDDADSADDDDEGESGKAVPWAAAWLGPQWVVFGHNAKRGLQIRQMALGLDTGCVYGRKLTAAVVDIPNTDIGVFGKPSFYTVDVESGQPKQHP